MKAYFQILAACLIWGTYGVFVQKMAYPPEVIVFFRFFFGALFLVILSYFTGRISQLRPSSHTGFLFVIGCINAASWLMMTRSIMYTSVANGFILLYTAPCFVILLAPFILREPFEKKSLLALAVSFAGIILIAGSGAGGLKEYNLWGSLLGLSSGILFALYLVALKKLPSGLLGLVTNTYMSFIIALVTLPLAAPSVFSVTLPDLLELAFMGIMIQAVGTTIYMIGLRKVKAQHGAILCYFEALFAMLFAALFLHERITPVFLAGAVLIIGGGLIIALKRKERSSAAENCRLPKSN
ncbi:MAG: hypothetical protein JL50_12665 [Peptococcaceae bacterium BICA1-7]|nr:MAG: hypothetical protein JL50_12665 [Peptococcaceae bacterium BICA1-7]